MVSDIGKLNGVKHLTQFVFADGSVTFLSENVDMKLYRDLSTMRGAEVIDADDL